MTASTASVLTVDDDPIVRAELRIVLEEAGFSVCPDANDGGEAIELARKYEPDVILVDFGAHRVDGIKTTRRLRAERDVPIIALSGRSDTVMRDAVEAGATTFLQKPVDAPALVDAVRLAVGHDEASALHGKRAESLRALSELVVSLGYPASWATELERRAFSAGRVWQRMR